MTSLRDHFSFSAANYATYRPYYPDELFAWLAEVAPNRDSAWDCGTGSGQAAVGLASRFAAVVATSLVTVGQALHWFDRPAFYGEVRRVLRPGGVLAVWSYGLCGFGDAALDGDPFLAPGTRPLLACGTRVGRRRPRRPRVAISPSPRSDGRARGDVDTRSAPRPRVDLVRSDLRPGRFPVRSPSCSLSTWAHAGGLTILRAESARPWRSEPDGTRKCSGGRENCRDI